MCLFLIKSLRCKAAADFLQVTACESTVTEEAAADFLQVTACEGTAARCSL